MVKSNTQPLCRWCGKPLRKYTANHYFGANVAAYAGSPDRAIHHAEKPTTQAEAQRYVNQEIVSIQWSKLYKDGDLLPRSEQFIHKVGLWDGESYAAVREFFCTNDCAMSLGHAAAKHHNIVGKAFNEATRRHNAKRPTP